MTSKSLDRSQKIYNALSNTVKASKLELTFAQLFGERAVLVQKDRRFTTRRLGKKVYLVDERIGKERRKIVH